MDVEAQAGREINSLFLCLFVLSEPSVDWLVPIHIGKGEFCLLRLLIQKLNSSQNTLTPPKIMPYHMSGHPLTWWS